MSSLTFRFHRCVGEGSLKAALRTMLADFPIRFSEARIHKGLIRLMFGNCKQAFLYGLKLLEESDWKQPLKESVSLLSVESVDNYFWRNIIRLGTSDPDFCKELVNSALESDLISYFEHESVYVGLCSVRKELFLFSYNPHDKNLSANLLVRRKYRFAGHTLKSLQAVCAAGRRRKKRWEEWNADSQTKY